MLPKQDMYVNLYVSVNIFIMYCVFQTKVIVFPSGKLMKVLPLKRIHP